MSNQIELIIQAAIADIGYKESPPNSNRTKYGKWYGMDGQPWCMMAVQYWFDQAGLSPLLYRTASCTALMIYAKANGLFHTTGFRRGDLALFNWQSKKDVAQHIGIITGFTAGNVLTIEGNTAVGNDSDGGEVMRRTRGYGTIIGVYRPKYEESGELSVSQYEELKKIIDTQDKRIKELESRTLPKYKTLGDVPEWGQVAVGDAIERGILSGVSAGDLVLSWDDVRALTMAWRRESGGV